MDSYWGRGRFHTTLTGGAGDGGGGRVLVIQRSFGCKSRVAPPKARRRAAMAARSCARLEMNHSHSRGSPVAVAYPLAGAEAATSTMILLPRPSSEERRVGTECVRTCRSRWSQYH